MSIVTEKPISPGRLSNSTTTLYTVLDSVDVFLLKSLEFVNTDTARRTVTIYIVPSGGTASDDNVLLRDRPVAAKDNGRWESDRDGYPMAVGDTIQGKADAATKVNVLIHGTEYRT